MTMRLLQILSFSDAHEIKTNLVIIPSPFFDMMKGYDDY